MHVEIKPRRRGFNGFFEVGWVAFAGNLQAKGEAHCERREYARPQGARTPPPGPCLGLSGSPGAEVGEPSTLPHLISCGAAADHRARDHVVGIAMQIPRDVRKGTCVFHTRRLHVAPGNVSAQPALRRFSGEYDGREANCSAVWIDVRWTIRDQFDPERNNHLSGMIPSVCDADASLRPTQSGARGGASPHSRDHSQEKCLRRSADGNPL